MLLLLLLLLILLLKIVFFTGLLCTSSSFLLDTIILAFSALYILEFMLLSGFISNPPEVIVLASGGAVDTDPQSARPI
jgi:hypothetical protein